METLPGVLEVSTTGGILMIEGVKSLNFNLPEAWRMSIGRSLVCGVSQLSHSFIITYPFCSSQIDVSCTVKTQKKSQWPDITNLGNKNLKLTFIAIGA